MKVPGGKHTIEFKFNPAGFGIGETISIITSALIILMLLGYAGF